MMEARLQKSQTLVDEKFKKNSQPLEEVSPQADDQFERESPAGGEGQDGLVVVKS